MGFPLASGAIVVSKVGVGVAAPAVNVTAHIAVWSSVVSVVPLVAVAVMVAVPAATAVTTPLASTVATVGKSVSVSLCAVAFQGVKQKQ